MKKNRFLLLAFGLLLAAFGCKKEQIETLETQSLAEVLDFLGCHGFHTDDAVSIDGDIVLEGDILISEETVQEMMNANLASLMEEEQAEERQYANPTVNGVLVSTTIAPNINYYIDPSVATIPTTGANWVSAIETACLNWTNIANCRVSMTKVNNHSNAHISFFRDNNTTLPPALQNLQSPNGTVIAAACFPKDGLPGRFVSINDASALSGMTIDQCKHTIRHEIGHTLGLRHNNSGSSGGGTNSCGGSYGSPQLITGTPADDPNSVMNSGALTLNFSADDIKAAQFLYPDNYNTPVINNVMAGSSGNVILTANAPTGQAPYRVIIGRYALNGTYMQGYEFLNPGNQTTFSVQCPPGTWKFKMKYANYGSFTSNFSNEVIALSGLYELKRKETTKCLDAANCGNTNGTNVQLWEDNNLECQRWVVTLENDGFYELKRQNTTQNLDAANCGTSNGTNVHLWPDNNFDCQRWKISLESDGFFELKRKGTTKNLDASGCGSSNGTNVQLWEDNSLNCQRWGLTFFQ